MAPLNGGASANQHLHRLDDLRVIGLEAAGPAFILKRAFVVENRGLARVGDALIRVGDGGVDLLRQLPPRVEVAKLRGYDKAYGPHRLRSESSVLANVLGMVFAYKDTRVGNMAGARQAPR